MITLKVVIVLCGVVGFVKADYCQKNSTLGQLPGGLLEEAISLILTGTLGSFHGCPSNTPPVLQEEVQFRLYTRDNPVNPTLLDPNNPVGVDPNKPFKIIIPGWTCDVNGFLMPEMRAAYLKRCDCNVIGIDWSAVNRDLYSLVTCRVPGVGKIVGKFICTLAQLLNVDITRLVHLIGHSLGGQVSGFAGQEVQAFCNKKIYRITGLDMAGPLYNDKPTDQRLDSADATFVDAIHTNGHGLGFFKDCGHEDFYPNCGIHQNGCPEIYSIEQILNLELSLVSCSHVRALLFWIESINPGNKVFTATSCQQCGVLPGTCYNDIFYRKYNVMGEDCSNNTPGTKFRLSTNSDSPFARG